MLYIFHVVPVSADPACTPTEGVCPEDVPWVSDYVFKEEHVWVPALGHAALEQDEGTGPMEVSKVPSPQI